MKKVLFVSDSVMKNTGYGVVSRNIITKLLKSNKFEIAQLGLNNSVPIVDLPIHNYTVIKEHKNCCSKGNVIEYCNLEKKISYINVHPLVSYNQDQKVCVSGIPSRNESYGYDSVYYVINHFKPDIVVPINDIWGLYNLGLVRNRNSFKLVPYLAIDSECIFPEINPINPYLPKINLINTLGLSDRIVVFTEWAKNEINKTCRIVINKEVAKINVIPHGVDTSIWKPLDNKKELRRKYFNINDNTFLVGCFLKDTPVLMSDLTTKPIQDIKSGDEIINHLGEKDYVISPDPKEYNGDIYTLNIAGILDPITATQEHPFYAIHPNQKHGYPSINTCFNRQDPEWIEIKNLKEGSWLVEPIITDIIDIDEISTDEIEVKMKNAKKLPNKIKLDEDFMRYLGLFVAEGSFQYSWARGKKYEASLYFNFNSKEPELIKFVEDYSRKLNVNTNTRVSYRNSMDIGHVTIEVNSVQLFRLFKKLLNGDKCQTKSLSKEFLLLPPYKQLAFLKGWEEGNGCNTRDGRQIVITTCKEMARQAEILYARNKIACSITVDNYCNRLNSKHSIKYRVTTNLKELHIKIHNNFIYRRINSINKKYFNGTVYNFEVKNKNSYVIGNVGVHNSISRNQPRKRFDAVLQVVKIFKEKYQKPNRDLRVYFHCSPNDELGWNLPWLAKYYGVDEYCIFNKDLVPGKGPTTTQLNEIANCFDAHILLSNSEGWCSFGDTRIITPDGIKQLQDFNKDDLVITHNGNINKVIEPLSRNYTGTMYGFKYLGSSLTVWFTPNHRLFVANKELLKEWVPAGFVNKGHYLCLPKYKKLDSIENVIDTKYMIEKYTEYKVVEKNNFIYGLKNNKPNLKSKPVSLKLTIDENTAEFIGNYIAEGSCGHDDIKISINASSDDIIRNNTIELANKLKLNYKSYIMKRNRENICITSRTLSNLFKSFGSKAYNKKIPTEIYDILKTNEVLCKKFLNGVIEGDGHVSNKNGIVYTTTSEVLSYQIKYLFLTLGIYSKIYITKRKINRNSIVVQIQLFKDLKKCKEFINKCNNIDFSIKRKKIDYVLEDNDYFYIPIKKIFKKEYSGKVYNISVENDESYLTDGFAVHNCLPLLETAAAGIPNITTNYSAAADWGKDTFLLSKVSAYEHETRTGFIKALVDVNHTAKQLELLYNSEKMCREYSRKGIDLGKKLQWDTVTEDWVDLLDSIPLNFEQDRFKNLDPELVKRDLRDLNNKHMNLKYLP